MSRTVEGWRSARRTSWFWPQGLHKDPVDLPEVFGSEIHIVESAEVLLELLHAAHTDDRGRDTRIAQHPRQRHLRQLLSAELGDLVEVANARHVLIHGLRGE